MSPAPPRLRLWPLGPVGLAVVLATAAVLVPSAAWYVVGMRAAEQEARLARERDLEAARTELQRRADRIQDRLEALRLAESARPSFQYQPYYHDPRGASQGASLLPSPLGDRPGDRLVAAYLRWNAAEPQITLPILLSDLPSPPLNDSERSALTQLHAHIQAQRLRLQGELQDVITRSATGEEGLRHELLASPEQLLWAETARTSTDSRPPPTPVPSLLADVEQKDLYLLEPPGVPDPKRMPLAQRLEKNGQAPGLERQKKVASRKVKSKVETLSPLAFAQNVAAPELFQTLKEEPDNQARVASTLQAALSNLPVNSSIAGFQIRVPLSDLQWLTLENPGEPPRLMALRLVKPPGAIVYQGIVLIPELLEELESESATGDESAHTQKDAATRSLTRASLRRELPGPGAVPEFRLEAGAVSGDLEVALPGLGTPWKLRKVGDLASDAALARAMRQDFLQSFGLGLLAALGAAAGLVALVWQAERLARSRSRFAASAAHELRTPLAGLRLYSEMLAEGLGDPSRAREYARRVASESERLARVVANVLEFSRLERGRLAVKVGPGDLLTAVNTSIERQRPSLEALGASVQLEAPHTALPPTRFDGDALEHILQNLLDNAEKYTRGCADRRIVVALRQEEDRAIVQVRDRGPGIPQRIRRRLFRPFSRGDGQDLPAGLGLGLSLARALAEAQDGSLRLVENPARPEEQPDTPGSGPDRQSGASLRHNAGACFELSLPLQPVNAQIPNPHGESA